MYPPGVAFSQEIKGQSVGPTEKNGFGMMYIPGNRLNRNTIITENGKIPGYDVFLVITNVPGHPQKATAANEVFESIIKKVFASIKKLKEPFSETLVSILRRTPMILTSVPTIEAERIIYLREYHFKEDLYDMATIVDILKKYIKGQKITERGVLGSIKKNETAMASLLSQYRRALETLGVKITENLEKEIKNFVDIPIALRFLTFHKLFYALVGLSLASNLRLAPKLDYKNTVFVFVYMPLGVYEAKESEPIKIKKKKEDNGEEEEKEILVGEQNLLKYTREVKLNIGPNTDMPLENLVRLACILGGVGPFNLRFAPLVITKTDQQEPKEDPREIDSMIPYINTRNPVFKIYKERGKIYIIDPHDLPIKTGYLQGHTNLQASLDEIMGQIGDWDKTGIPKLWNYIMASIDRVHQLLIMNREFEAISEEYKIPLDKMKIVYVPIVDPQGNRGRGKTTLMLALLHYLTRNYSKIKPKRLGDLELDRISKIVKQYL